MNALLPNGPAEVWANLKRLYPIYSALTREFAIEKEPCLDLEEAPQVPSADAIAGAEKWFEAMDVKIKIQHLRQFVQTSSKVNDAVLQDLLVHFLDKKQRSEQDRDKVDFLLVQLFSEHVPPGTAEEGLSLEDAANLIKPIFGAVEIKAVDFLKPLDDLVAEAKQHKTLNSLFTARLIERGRRIKQSCGDNFFDPLAMLAFARFGFLMRRAFFRLMHQDLNVTLDGLRELEARGFTTIDCRKAQFSAEEPISRLRMICQSWKVMFQAEYSAGQPLCILVDLRTAVETAMKKSSGAAKTRAARVGAGSSASGEFKVSGGAASTDTE